MIIFKAFFSGKDATNKKIITLQPKTSESCWAQQRPYWERSSGSSTGFTCNSIPPVHALKLGLASLGKSSEGPSRAHMIDCIFYASLLRVCGCNHTCNTQSRWNSHTAAFARPNGRVMEHRAAAAAG